jgi:imidazole glycerol-phosphate synthase subunit HisF
MLKTRIIPVVLVKNGRVVQSKGFKRHQVLGNATSIVWRLSNWFSDELIYLDISREEGYSLNREDLNYKNHDNILDIIEEVSRKCFMPLTIGGRIKTLEDVYLRLKKGADKVAINSQAFLKPGFIKSCSQELGSQCIIASIDYKRVEDGKNEVFIDCGRKGIEVEPVEWARAMEAEGAGEILLNSIDRDGRAKGYDLEMIEQVSSAVSIPVIAQGGVGTWEHFEQGIEHTRAKAFAAANIFQYTENSVYNANTYLYDKGCPVRIPLLKTMVDDKGVIS